MASQGPAEASSLVPPLVRLARRGSLLIASDFDGTLAQVVRDPRRARALPQASRALAELARRTPVAVISGRDLANLAVQCRVPGAVLLGSYGLEPWLNPMSLRMLAVLAVWWSTRPQRAQGLTSRAGMRVPKP